MGFLGGGFFGSGASSSSSTARVNEQGSQNSGFGSMGLNFSTGNVGKKGRQDITLNMTDHGAIAMALEGMATSGRDVLEYSGGMVQATYAAQEKALGSAFNAFSSALDMSNAARVDALEFAGGAVTALQSGNRNALEMARGSYQDAMEFAAGAFTASTQAQISARDSVERQANSALMFGAGSMELVDSAYSDAIGFVQEASKSESAKLSEKVVYAAMAALALVIWRGK